MRAGIVAVFAAAALSPSLELSRSRIEERVRQAAAVRLGLPAADLRVVSSDERTWPDRSLGCGRRGLTEPEPTPGYAFVLDVDGRPQTYHTDRTGRIVRCPAAGKPLGPIQR
jgi:hypothetical protein